MTPFTVYRPGFCERVYRAVVSLGMGAAFLLLVLFAWWLFYPYKGIQTYDLRILTPVVQPGGLLRWEVDYCVDARTPVPAQVDREMVLQNHVIAFPIPDVGYVIQQRCETKSRVIGIPEYAPGGTYHLEISTSLEVNPLRRLRQSWRSGTFTVVEKTP
jgi:hypothetical protein